MAITAVIILTCCNKHVESVLPAQSPPPPPPAPIKHLFADAGSDTTICMPYGGTGNLFKGFLDGRASHDDSGKIVRYSWSEVVGDPVMGSSVYPQSQLAHLSKDSTEITFFSGTHVFNLEVWDDQGRYDYDHVTINAVSRFNYEYDGLSWDSAVGKLTAISVKVKPGLLNSWPDIDSSNTNLDVYVNDYNGICLDNSSWKKLPLVPYDSIQLTTHSAFYSLISDFPTSVNHGTFHPVIYINTNSGANLNQRVSVAFNESDNPNRGFSGAGDWDP